MSTQYFYRKLLSRDSERNRADRGQFIAQVVNDSTIYDSSYRATAPENRYDSYLFVGRKVIISPESEFSPEEK